MASIANSLESRLGYQAGWSGTFREFGTRFVDGFGPQPGALVHHTLMARVSLSIKELSETQRSEL